MDVSLIKCEFNQVYDVNNVNNVNKNVDKLNSAKHPSETTPAEEKLLQDNRVHHNVFNVDKDDQMEESYDDPLEKKKRRNKQDKRWLKADKILITAVQMRPCLWNHAIRRKEKRILKAHDAWSEVLKELKDYKFTLKDVKKRWRNLRDSFNKAKNKKNAFLSSGSAALTTNDDSTFRHYENMLFLIDELKPRLTRNNISKMSHSCDSNKAPSISTALDVNAIKESVIDIYSSSTSGINSNISENSSRKEHEDIEFQKQLVNDLPESNQSANGFLLYLSDILKKLPYKERRTLEKKILNLAYKTEQRAEL